MQKNKEVGKNLPEKKFSTGAISATIWKNTTTNKNKEIVEYSTISFDRRYKDKNDKWQTTNHLRLNDLPKANLVLKKAYEFLVLKDQETNSEDNNKIKEDII